MYLDTSNVQSLKEKLLLCAVNEFAEYGYEGARVDNIVKEGANKQVISSQADSLIKISRIWAD
ncbi:hypothetical protein ABN114_20105, partial [Escherichia coli]